MRSRLVPVAAVALAGWVHAWSPSAQATFRFEEVMVPVRDGVRLQTVLLTPINARGPLPILLRRTPYGVPSEAPATLGPGAKELTYDGLTTAMALLAPHPALKAISEQASPVDQWMNDDMHRFGALRESYAFEYAVLEQADKNQNTHFTFDAYDTYAWYQMIGPLSNLDQKHLHGAIPYWNEIVTHPDYDAFWKKEAWVSQLHRSSVPNLNVAGFWDQEDPWGPWQIFRHAEEHDPDNTNFMVAGPWYHGQWRTAKGDSIGAIPLGGHETAREFRENIEGTDADFIVKLIDVFPEGAQRDAWNADTGPAPREYARSLNGYELPIAMEARRGRLQRQLRTPACAAVEPARRMEDPAPRSRPCVRAATG